MTPEEIVERVAEVLDAIGALRNVTDATDEQVTWIDAPLEVVVEELVRAGLLPTETAVADEATILDQQARLLAPELHEQFIAGVSEAFDGNQWVAGYADLPEEARAGYQGLARWILTSTPQLNEYLRPILDEAASEFERMIPPSILITDEQAHDLELAGRNPGHQHCPDCGCDPADHTLHADGCPRIGTPAQHELNQ